MMKKGGKLWFLNKSIIFWRNLKIEPFSLERNRFIIQFHKNYNFRRIIVKNEFSHNSAIYTIWFIWYENSLLKNLHFCDYNSIINLIWVFNSNSECSYWIILWLNHILYRYSWPRIGSLKIPHSPIQE